METKIHYQTNPWFSRFGQAVSRRNIYTLEESRRTETVIYTLENRISCSRYLPVRVRVIFWCPHTSLQHLFKLKSALTQLKCQRLEDPSDFSCPCLKVEVHWNIHLIHTVGCFVVLVVWRLAGGERCMIPSQIMERVYVTWELLSLKRASDFGG